MPKLSQKWNHQKDAESAEEEGEGLEIWTRLISANQTWRPKKIIRSHHLPIPNKSFQKSERFERSDYKIWLAWLPPNTAWKRSSYPI